jgi:hypothetical protein
MGKDEAASICGFLAALLRELARTTGFTAPGLTGFLVVFALVLLVLLLSGLTFLAMNSPLFTKIIACCLFLSMRSTFILIEQGRQNFILLD